MSTISDVQELFDSIRNTWAKNRADVIAHITVAIVVFVLCGVSFPQITLPTFDVKQITNNEWFIIANETGFTYVLLVIHIIVVAVYTAVLRLAAKVLATIVIVIFRPRADLSKLNTSTLEPLALTLKKKHFDFSDLFEQSQLLLLRYRAKKNEVWEEYMNIINGIAKNSQVYIGDFLVFTLIWISLFRVFPHAAWIQANQIKFWSVTGAMLILVLFAWFRVFHALKALPALQIRFLSQMIRSDPDMENLLNVDDGVRRALREKLEELIQKDQQHAYFRREMNLRSRLTDYIENLAWSLWRLVRYFVTGAP
jgi:hypothetical protein